MPSTRDLLSKEELDFLLSPTAHDPDTAPEDGTLPGPAADGEQAADGTMADEEALRDGGAARQAHDGACGGSGRPAEDRRAPLPEQVFATLLEKALSRLTRSFVALDWQGVRTVRCRELLDELEEPATLALVQARPLARKALFYIDADLTQALADVSLGADCRPNDERRPLTALDRLLVRRCLDRVMTCLATAWTLPCVELLRHVQYGSDIFLTQAETRLRVIDLAMDVDAVHGRCLLALPADPDRT